MTRFFTRERFGRPQFLAGALLLAFLAQAIWLVHSELHASSDAPQRLRASPHRRRLAPTSRRRHRRRPLPRSLQAPSPRNLARRQRLRHRTLPTALPRNRRTTARLAPAPAQSRILSVLALAPAPSFPGLRSLPRRFALVRSPPSLRQHRRLPRPNPLLLFSVDDPGQRRLAHRTRNPRRLGILRRHLHRHRRRPHSLRPARSHSLELASHRPARNLSGHRRRIPVLHDRRRARWLSPSCFI